MDGPIYVFSRVRFTEAWYQLSQTEKDNLLAENDSLGKQFGSQTTSHVQLTLEQRTMAWIWG